MTLPPTQSPPLEPGRHAPFGAHVRDGGVNFAVYSESATAIELCLFDASGRTELHRLPLHGPTNGVFHGFCGGLGVGAVYGFRAQGDYAPERGLFFNSFKVLLDPYAREIVGDYRWLPEQHGYVLGAGVHTQCQVDNATVALKARVAPPSADLAGWLSAPRIPARDQVLYEVHVKGFSQTHADIPAEIQGTYAALAHPASVAYFKALGVTTLALLPVQYFLDEPGLAQRGMTNYWGYNTIGFFCPSTRLSARKHDPSAAVAEFKAMVTQLHANGLEVVLDVVYNHTAEGNQAGPTLSFRGLDHPTWYRLQSGNPACCENFTGCGNTLHTQHPRATQMVLDSLRYWVREMGVDGFRFDLAPVLGRTAHGFETHAAFFSALQQDPVLAQAHMIAEPWDAGPNGYQVGHFPGPWLEWNDKFRDTVRGYWLGAAVDRADLARRFLASSDLFNRHQRPPTTSVNFVAVHDGYTLADVVSYSQKHNHANGEDNRDGRDDELCRNFGVEGLTQDARILAVRRRVNRAMLATLLLAQGTPMLCAGDEIGKSQGGNNNAYCQDSAVSWLDWARADADLLGFVQSVLALRKTHGVLRYDQWFHAQPKPGEASVAWFKPDGCALSSADWHDTAHRSLACTFTPPPAGVGASAGGQILVAFNPGATDMSFCLAGGVWQVLLDSTDTLKRGLVVNDAITVGAHGLVVCTSHLKPVPNNS